MLIKKLKKSSGFTLVEVLVAFVLLAIAGVAILSAFGGVFKANTVANFQTTGLSVAQTQLEYMANQTANVDATDKVGYYNTTAVPAGYTLWTVPRGSNPDGTGQPVQCTPSSTDPKTGLIGIPWDDQTGASHNKAVPAPTSTDKNVQKITVIVKEGSEIVATISSFRIKPPQ